MYQAIMGPELYPFHTRNEVQKYCNGAYAQIIRRKFKASAKRQFDLKVRPRTSTVDQVGTDRIFLKTSNYYFYTVFLVAQIDHR